MSFPENKTSENTKEIGAYEAKTSLPKLLREVQQGQHFTITKHGQPIAQLIPVNAEEQGRRLAATRRMRALMHSSTGLSGRAVSTSELIAWRDEDRR
ncbi:MAG: type II toxin-antitoxin system prevent-host-death family antitoxin [Burkholderiaceae bacterium]